MNYSKLAKKIGSKLKRAVKQSMVKKSPEFKKFEAQQRARGRKYSARFK